MQKIDTNIRSEIFNRLDPIDIIQLCATDSIYKKFCNTPGVFESLMIKFYPEYRIVSGISAREAFNRITKRKGILYGFELSSKKDNNGEFFTVNNGKLYKIGQKYNCSETIKIENTQYITEEKVVLLYERARYDDDFEKMIFDTRREAVEWVVRDIRDQQYEKIIFKWQNDYDWHYEHLQDDIEYLGIEDDDVPDFMITHLKGLQSWNNENDPSDEFNAWLEHMGWQWIWDEELAQKYHENHDVNTNSDLGFAYSINTVSFVNN